VEIFEERISKYFTIRRMYCVGIHLFTLKQLRKRSRDMQNYDIMSGSRPAMVGDMFLCVQLAHSQRPFTQVGWLYCQCKSNNENNVFILWIIAARISIVSFGEITALRYAIARMESGKHIVF
jgi:hypothetical protein